MTETFPFTLHGRDGTVTATCDRNDDPERFGYSILGLPWPASLATGLPVLRAEVAFAGEGYLAVMGWIQVVRITVFDSSTSLVPDGEKAPAGDHVWLDLPPSLSGLGVPFVSFGPCPELIDAPSSTESDTRFVADSFLTASPDGLMSRRSQPFFGLRWGYSTERGREPELIAPTALGAGSWRAALPTLRGELPDWTFLEEWGG
jgi:hypothetical protein